MRFKRVRRTAVVALGFVLAPVALECMLAFPRKPAEVPGGPAQSAHASSSISLPVGTILPVRLNKTISKDDAHVGQAIEAEIMQDVPLPNREKIHLHSHVSGTIVSVSAAEGTGFQVALRFDKIEYHNEIIPMTTRVRAIASFLMVEAALLPPGGADVGTPTGWATTVQVGGDVRYGDGGEVVNRQKQKVGKGMNGGGVLVHVRAQAGSGCEGAVNGNDSLQALWVFSSDACGVYGFPGVQVIHDGTEAPIGVFTVSFEKSDTKIDEGSGMLLRVIAAK